MRAIDQFPVLEEHLKQGTAIERMIDKGFDISDIRYMLMKYRLGDLVIDSMVRLGILTYLKNSEDLHIELDYTRPK